MVLDKLSVLRPLIQSSNGIHLTAYIENKGDPADLKNQIQIAIDKCESDIGQALRPMDRRLFLAPLRLLKHDDRLLAALQHNIAVFRTSKMFRVLALPIEVDRSCVVATSFHVKPLLRWMRVDKEFLLLGLTPTAAHLFLGTQQTLRVVDTLDLTDETDDPTGSIGRWVKSHTRLAQPELFVSGERKMFRSFVQSRAYPRTNMTLLNQQFSSKSLSELCSVIRCHLEVEAVSDLEKTFTEFYCVEDYRAAPRNLFQIAKAVARGRVRKLIVADGVKIFGRFNSKTGALVIHPRDLDHEDDDILDDLAQTVLSKGGEVFVTQRDEIPEGQIAWALLDRSDIEKSVSLIGTESERQQ